MARLARGAARTGDKSISPRRTKKTIQAILRHADVSTTNTYYIKSADDDTRAAMAKLERLVIGNEQSEILESANEVATNAAEATTAAIQ